MIRFMLSRLAVTAHGERRGNDIAIDEVTPDTHKVTAGCLLVALKDERLDTHDSTEQTKAAGAGTPLVSRPLTRDLPQVIVKDTRQAFDELAAWVHQQTPTHVVALAGSSGKTSVKEMTMAVPSQCGNALYTAGNLNNDIGVPMTLLCLTKEYQYVVIELGTNHQDEIVWTVSLTHPEVALASNLAAAHLEDFGPLMDVAKAKGEIYTGLLENGIATLNADNSDWLSWWVVIGNRKVWRFPPNVANSDFTATNMQITSHGTEFTLQIPIDNVDVLLSLSGRHNITNVLAVASLTMAVGTDLTAVKTGLARLKVVPGCLFPIRLAESQLLLDDSYNTSVGPMTATVQVLLEMPGFQTIVVGNMAEPDAESTAYHREVGKVAKAAGLDCVLSVGTLSADISRASGMGEHSSDRAAIVVCLCELLVEHKITIISVKDSRSVTMEEVVRALQETGTY